MKTNMLEEIIKRLSKLESLLSGEPESEQPIGKYSDDMVEEINLYIDGIEKDISTHLKNTSQKCTSDSETLSLIADSMTKLIILIGDENTKEEKRKEDVNEIIAGICSKFPEKIMDVIVDSYNKSMNLLDKAKSTIIEGFDMNVSERNANLIEEFNKNIKLFRSNQFEKDVENKARIGVSNAISNEISRFISVVRARLDNIQRVVVSSYVTIFLSVLLFAFSVYNCHGANEKAKEVEIKQEEVKEQRNNILMIIEFNQWAIYKYPNLQEEFNEYKQIRSQQREKQHKKNK